MNRIPHATLVLLVAVGLTGRVARADIPADYKGRPFDPAVAGGPKCPATVKAGPYAIPGRLDFVNYDMGGDGVGYHTGDHEAKGGAGYRSDAPTATLSLTSVCIPNGGPPTCMNVWYDSGTALDGTAYPSPTTADFSIGAVQNGDYVNLTVNVATTGTYAVSSTWATGAGPPGGEGGDGSMGLAIFSNGTQLATWSAIFPNFNTEADFHHWKPYPSFATVTLTAGPQVIKLQSKAKHLQLDYVQFDLVGADGGVIQTDAGAPADGGATGAGGNGAGGSGGDTTGTAGMGAAGGTSGGAAGSASTGAGGDNSATGAAGSSGSGGASTTGSAGSSGGGTTGAAGAGTPGKTSKSGGCSFAPATSERTGAAGSFLAVAVMALGLLGRRRRRQPR